MKVAKACRECRLAKRKCTVAQPSTACEACQRNNNSCSFVSSTRERCLAPRQLTNNHPSVNTAIDALSETEIISLIDLYLTKVHNRPHSLFHPPSLRASVQTGTIRLALLCALCSFGCILSNDATFCRFQDPLISDAKSLLQADLENICLENIQVALLIANLCEWQGNRPSEALFFRKSAAIVRKLSTC